jgi:hypothetical protein
MQTLALIAVLLMMSVVNVHGAQGGNSLLDKATKIGAIDGMSDAYWWLTTDRIVYFEHVPRPISVLRRKALHVPPDYAPGHYRASTLDIASQKRMAFDTFNAVIGNTIAPSPMLMSYGGGPATETVYHMPSCAMSPDRNWLVWRSGSRWRAARLDGTRKHDWLSRSPNGYAFWLSNSKWAAVASNYRHGDWMYTGVTVRDMAGRTTRNVAMNEPEKGLILGATSDGALLSVDYVQWMQTETSVVGADRYDLAGTKAAVSHINIPLPGSYTIWSVTLSTQGDRLAWVLASGDLYHIFISDTHGKRWRDLGDVKQRTNSAGSREQVSWPQGVRWLPGDNALSFVFDCNLYRIAIPTSG